MATLRENVLENKNGRPYFCHLPCHRTAALYPAPQITQELVEHLCRESV